MNIPFSRKQLEDALAELDMMEFDHEQVMVKMATFQSDIEAALPRDEDELNILMAEHYGMTVGKLASSQLRPIFLQKYVEFIIERSIEKLMVILGISEVQAWALFINSMEDPNTDPGNGPTN